MESFVSALARPRNAAALLFAASALALATAYAAQYIGGLEPCPLCLYQRVPYAVGGALAAAALMTRASGLLALLLLLAAAAFFVNTWIAFYHLGVENHLWASAVCTGDAPVITSVEDLRRALAAPPPKPCDAVDWTLFGVSMAGYNVIVSAALAGLAIVAAARARWGDPRP
ncbi:MAG: disulfide bond formation protein B [Pseudomonadota bacterium]